MIHRPIIIVTAFLLMFALFSWGSALHDNHEGMNLVKQQRFWSTEFHKCVETEKKGREKMDLLLAQNNELLSGKLQIRPGPARRILIEAQPELMTAALESCSTVGRQEAIVKFRGEMNRVAGMLEDEAEHYLRAGIHVIAGAIGLLAVVSCFWGVGAKDIDGVLAKQVIREFGDLLVVTDHDYRIKFVSYELCEKFGLTAHRLRGKDLNSFLPEGHKEMADTFTLSKDMERITNVTYNGTRMNLRLKKIMCGDQKLIVASARVLVEEEEKKCLHG